MRSNQHPSSRISIKMPSLESAVPSFRQRSHVRIVSGEPEAGAGCAAAVADIRRGKGLELPLLVAHGG